MYHVAVYVCCMDSVAVDHSVCHNYSVSGPRALLLLCIVCTCRKQGVSVIQYCCGSVCTYRRRTFHEFCLAVVQFVPVEDMRMEQILLLWSSLFTFRCCCHGAQFVYVEGRDS